MTLDELMALLEFFGQKGRAGNSDGSPMTTFISKRKRAKRKIK